MVDVKGRCMRVLSGVRVPYFGLFLVSFFVATLLIQGMIVDRHLTSGEPSQIDHLLRTTVNYKPPSSRKMQLDTTSNAARNVDMAEKTDCEPSSSTRMQHDRDDKVDMAEKQLASPNKPNPATRPWMSVNIIDYGAIGDNETDNTHAIQDAINAVVTNGGGEVVIPRHGVFQTAPVSLTSNMIFRVDGILFGISNQDKYPALRPLPTYVRDPDFQNRYRRQALVRAVNETNVTISGHGTIDGGGWYWYPCFKNHELCHNIGRPHLLELESCTNVEITSLTLKNAAFWTLHPVYCKNVHIHHMNIVAPYCRLYNCANTDGIDVDSSENVLIEHNVIEVGDDHITVISGRRRNDPNGRVSKNITIRYNTLLTGMGLSIGSGTAGGVEDVVFQNNVMLETRGHVGQGLHIKTRSRYGGFVRNIAWIDNVFYVAGTNGGAIKIETGYQSNGADCTLKKNSCTDVRDILIRNLTVHNGNPGSIICSPENPCNNITLENVRFLKPRKKKLGCQNVLSGTVVNMSPPILDGCPGMARAARNPTAEPQ